MAILIIDPTTSSRTRCGEPINTHPSQYLVVGPGVTVRPVVELFVDPGEQGDGTVVETVAEGLRFRGLDFVVAGAFVAEPVTSGDAGFFAS